MKVFKVKLWSQRLINAHHGFQQGQQRTKDSRDLNQKGTYIPENRFDMLTDRQLTKPGESRERYD